MHINYVRIENYRNFQKIEIPLSKLSIIIGENDCGKSNFINAIKLALNNNELEYFSKRLSHSDINFNSVKKFYLSLKKHEDYIIPEVRVTLRFSGITKDDLSLAIVNKWLNEVDGNATYEIQYLFKPSNQNDLIDYCKEQIKDFDENLTDFQFILPTELYDSNIISTNNFKAIPFTELKHININNIYAERDDFSDSRTMKSNSILTKLLENKLSEVEKVKIYNSYNAFFKNIKEQDNFKKIFTHDEDFPDMKDFIELIDCIPNLANLKNILSNITLGYGNEYLYQKGLGQRNLIYILLFFQHFKDNKSNFSINCIEEPEAHLSTNNLNFIIDYINKSVNNSESLFQVIITSHKPEVINKLNFKNVIALSGTECISFCDVEKELVDYLSKRPNFDILKLLFSNRIILVEGTTEEMLINTFLSKSNELNNIDVISIGQKGFKTFLNIWLTLNSKNNKKIGIIRDFDNQENAKLEHTAYDDGKNILVRTTVKYTLEDDLVLTGDNCKAIADFFSINNSQTDVVDFLKDSKASNMLELCYGIHDNKIKIELPQHVKEILGSIKND
ncbi:MAG: AAA family ATPase [Flavobacteriaceae bacterium]|nr:AAA family ATPase [Flavobacteriaceae bacterium]